MAKFVLEMSTDNAAFEEVPHLEIARILHETSVRITREPDAVIGMLRDINGNTVGKWELKAATHKTETNDSILQRFQSHNIPRK